MSITTTDVTTRELRDNLSDVISRARFGNERIGVTRNGKLAAVIISVEDATALEEYEMAQDLAAYRKAKAEDDGSRISLDDLATELNL